MKTTAISLAAVVVLASGSQAALSQETYSPEGDVGLVEEAERAITDSPHLAPAPAFGRPQDESPELLGPTDVPEVLERPLADPAKTPDEIADGVLSHEELTGQEYLDIPRVLPNLAAQEPEVSNLFRGDGLAPPGYWDAPETARSYGEIPPPQGDASQRRSPRVAPTPTHKHLFVPPSD